MSLFVTRTSGDVIAEIKMNMTTFNGGYLLVEGPSDSRFFSPRIAQVECQIVICGAKTTVVQTAKDAKAATKSNTLGIIDDDFDSHIGIQHNCKDLIATETHDIETLMLNSPAIARLTSEYADQKKLLTLSKIENKTLSDSLLDRSLPFGKLRYINAKHNLNVSFEKFLSPWKFIDHTTWKLNETALFDQFSTLSGWNLKDIKKSYNAITRIPDWNLSQGHDTVNILAIAFKNVIKGKTPLSVEDICSALRLSFDPQTFAQTTLFKKIQSWEKISTQKILS